MLLANAQPLPVGGEQRLSPAQGLAAELVRAGLGPFLATPCGVLAPLLTSLGPRLRTVPREETSIGVAAGMALAGRQPVVLMQNSGFGASVNALASLTQPYAIALVLVISLRGVAPDSTAENLLMGRLTAPILDLLGIRHRVLAGARIVEDARWAATTVRQGRTAALLVPPDLFDWTPA